MTSLRRALNFTIIAAVCASTVVGAESVARAASPVDYGNPSTWLCRPGQKDACSVDLRATLIHADGTLTQEPWSASKDASVDCFYVYPTVSEDKLPNSDLMTHPLEEDLAVRQQFARFASKCRPFAPIYRQGTIPGLLGRTAPADFDLAFMDVRAAWNHYLTHWNEGRGVVLIGHSQGARMLKQLIQQEIDGTPQQARLVSAILAGANIALPQGQDVGGDFKAIRPCRSTDQVGCFISYVTFRKSSPPPSKSRYGRSPGPGLVVACTNPASLSGGEATLKPYFASNHRHIYFSTTAPLPKPWLRTSEEGIRTPFVSLPGMVVGRCVQNEHGSYLEISERREPTDPRQEEIEGEIYSNYKVLREWGLHLIDIHVVLGNLMELVEQQGRAYHKR